MRAVYTAHGTANMAANTQKARLSTGVQSFSARASAPRAAKISAAYRCFRRMPRSTSSSSSTVV